jgi:hypothetical protein
MPKEIFWLTLLHQALEGKGLLEQPYEQHTGARASAKSSVIMCYNKDFH